MSKLATAENVLSNVISFHFIADTYHINIIVLIFIITGCFYLVPEGESGRFATGFRLMTKFTTSNTVKYSNYY